MAASRNKTSNSLQNNTIRCICIAAAGLMKKQPDFTIQDIMEELQRRAKAGELDKLPCRDTVETYLENQFMREFISSRYPGVLLPLEEGKKDWDNLNRQLRRVLHQVQPPEDWDPTEVSQDPEPLFTMVEVEKEPGQKGSEKHYTLVPELPAAIWQVLADFVRSYPGFNEETARGILTLLKKYWLSGHVRAEVPMNRLGGTLYASVDLDRLQQLLALRDRPLLDITLETWDIREDGAPERRAGKTLTEVYPVCTVLYQGVQYLGILERRGGGWVPGALAMDRIHSIREEPLPEQEQPWGQAQTWKEQLQKAPALVLGPSGIPVTARFPLSLLEAVIGELGENWTFRRAGEQVQLEQVPPALANRLKGLYPEEVQVLRPRKQLHPLHMG